VEGREGKKEGVALYQKAVWSRDHDDGRAHYVAQPANPEAARREREAHDAVVEAIAELLGVDAALENEEGAEERLPAPQARRLAKRYAAAQLFADALRVLYNLPILQAKHAEATITAIYKTAGLKTL